MTGNYVRDWEELANADAKWAIVSDPRKKYNKWDHSDFFKTGETDVNGFIRKIRNYNVKLNTGEALDFGCGIGRLTTALSRFYDKVYGIDVSERMIREGRELNKENKKIEFILNTEPDLGLFNSSKFDLIYSVIVLQHLPDRGLIRSFLEEFKRVLKPEGILYFQLPSIESRTPFFDRLLKLRSSLYHFLLNTGFSRQFCFKRLNLSPYMYMNHISSGEIGELFSADFELLELSNDRSENTSYIFRKTGPV